jgi:hypothetical protein
VHPFEAGLTNQQNQVVVKGSAGSKEQSMGCKGVIAFIWNMAGCVIGGAVLGGLLGGAVAQAPGPGALLGAIALGTLGAMYLPSEIRKRQRLIDWYNRPFGK